MEGSNRGVCRPGSTTKLPMYLLDAREGRKV